MPAFPDRNRFGAMQAATQTTPASDPVGRFLRDSASTARDMRNRAWQRSAAARVARARPSGAEAGKRDLTDATPGLTAEPVAVIVRRR